jgi:hypothetical protein
VLLSVVSWIEVQFSSVLGSFSVRTDQSAPSKRIYMGSANWLGKSKSYSARRTCPTRSFCFCSRRI